MKPTSPRPKLTGIDRVKAVKDRRRQAADLATGAHRPNFEAHDNGDNASFDVRPMAFTKGLEHDDHGIIKSVQSYTKFENALTQPGPNGEETDAEFDVPGTKNRNTPFQFKTEVDGAPAKARTWESPLAGTYYVEEGPDPAAIGMPPAPRLGSSELCAEIAEVYAMALVRDMSFSDLNDAGQELYYIDETGTRQYHVTGPAGAEQRHTVGDLIDALNGFNWFDPNGTPYGGSGATLSMQLTSPEVLRRNRGKGQVQSQSVLSLFRGSAPFVEDGDYLSKFLTLETVDYGAHTIDQRIKPALPGLDYMTNWTAWLDVQNGANLKDAGAVSPAAGDRTIIETGRHLSRYVHVDQLYQAYHIAALVLAQSGFPTSTKFPENGDHKTRDAFASFGGPHLLALFAEVSSRALKAVRRQKYQIHRRARPERLASLLTLAANNQAAKLGNASARVESMLAELRQNFAPFLELIARHNERQNDANWIARRAADGKVSHTGAHGFEPAADANYLLPMAFAEGSPMHPSYGAGHAAVAGACITVLKAFFRTVDPDNGWRRSELSEIAAKANIADPGTLTVEGELNKLAANIAIGRDFAGVHYYSDYYESLRLGERVAVGILEEQMTNYNETVEMNFFSFDDDPVTIKTDGQGKIDLLVGTAGGTPAWWSRNTGASAANPQSNWQGM